MVSIFYRLFFPGLFLPLHPPRCPWPSTLHIRYFTMTVTYGRWSWSLRHLQHTHVFSLYHSPPFFSPPITLSTLLYCQTGHKLDENGCCAQNAQRTKYPGERLLRPAWGAWPLEQSSRCLAAGWRFRTCSHGIGSQARYCSSTNNFSVLSRFFG